MVHATLNEMRTAVVIIMMASCMVAHAQQEGTKPTAAVLQTCLLRTSDLTWAELKLTPDQLRRMGYIQEACQQECDAAGRVKSEDSISNADGEVVMEEVRSVLSREQYEAWVAHCQERKP